MRILIYISISILFLNIVFCQNATDCRDMYLNNTITIPCVDDRACCLIQYTQYNNNFTRCILKLNSTEDMCLNFADTIGFYFGSLTTCECASSDGFFIEGLNIFNHIIFFFIFFIFSI
jgi:hypothetical protein